MRRNEWGDILLLAGPMSSAANLPSDRSTTVSRGARREAETGNLAISADRQFHRSRL